MLGVLNDRLDLDRFSTARIRERVQKARRDAYVARNEGTLKLYALSVDGLSRAQDLLDHVPSPVAHPLRRVVDDGLEQFTRVPIADYDDLNVKRVGEALDGLSLIDLERVARYERANKGRKTVFRQIERARERVLGVAEAA